LPAERSAHFRAGRIWGDRGRAFRAVAIKARGGSGVTAAERSAQL